jgi:pimeloyl-ACP methyl ester carboxylesterase
VEKASSGDQNGEFAASQLIEWLDPAVYPKERHEFILGMMQEKEIGLCFRLPTEEERYLIPEGLPVKQPYLHYWPKDTLRFRYQYSLLPRALIPRFIVETHKNLTPQKIVWLTGVILNACQCEVLVMADVDKKRIDIQVDGPPGQRRSALAVILNDLQAVHALNPEINPEGRVPLPDDPEVDVGYNHLLELEETEGRDYEYRPEKAKRKYQVKELLEGVRHEARQQPGREGAPGKEAKPHIVILIHGIRDRALWQNELRKSLEAADFKMAPTNYGRFDLVRFLIPWQPLSRGIVDSITKQIRHALDGNGDADCSIIAHSFGTFIFSRILKKHTDLKFKRIILCGSVLPCKFEFEDYKERFEQPLLNEVGTRDFLPALAKSVTFGYGSAGTYGFGHSPVRDRWHNGANHGAFLKREFCDEYWVPFLRDGRIIDDSKEAERPRWWVELISWLKIKYLLGVGILGVIGYTIYPFVSRIHFE